MANSDRLCAVSGKKEAEYQAMVERYKAETQGQRGIDMMGQMFGELVNAMSESDSDILGDLFQGSITYGEAGQYFSPEAVTKLIAQIDWYARQGKFASDLMLRHDVVGQSARFLGIVLMAV